MVFHGSRLLDARVAARLGITSQALLKVNLRPLRGCVKDLSSCIGLLYEYISWSGARKLERQPQSSQPQPRLPKLGRVWWIVLLGLLLWNALLFLPTGTPQADLPYSAFIAQVQASNVKHVQITGSQIAGEFAAPLTWPPASEVAAAATAQANNLLSLAPLPQAQSYTAFNTTFPEVVGDTSLMPLLQAHNVVVDVSEPSTPWFTILLTTGLPILLLVLALVWMGRQASKSQSGIFSFGRAKARRYTEDRPKVTFADVAGADEAKSDLEEVVDFLRHPKKYHNIGARIPRGVLLVGPPGTGKTLMARAVAGEADVPFFNISASEFVEMFVGVGASRVRDLFERAKASAPAIVFIDELDAVGRRRGAGLGTVNDEREQTLNQLLVEMDGFDEHHEIIILAATNRPDVLDPALLRPGRFDREVTVALPDRRGREGILKIHTRDIALAPDVDLDVLARTTTGLSGADLANLCNEAALVAARHNRDRVTMADFEEAWDKILLGGERPALLDPHDREVVAYHEAGHALVAWLTPNADPVHKVTIIPHGRALGVTEQLPGEDHYNYSRSYLLARLDVMLGGRVSEEIAMGDITTGAENDLVQATQLARRMMTRWGMGSLGPIAFQADEQQPFLGYELAQGRDYSEETAARIDRDVEQLIADRREAARQVIINAQPKLDRLVNTLLREETVDQETLAQVLGPRSEHLEEVHHVPVPA
jgi:cell division protease FtsH